MAASRSYEGSCFCRKVRYRVNGPLGTMSHCHCTDCQKSNAAAFATYIDVERKDFAYTQGENNLTTFKAESGTKRSFCKSCGSTVACFTDSDPEVFEVAAATLDTPFDVRPAYHIFVRSKAPWYEIKDSLPQHKAGSGKGY